MHSTFDGVSGGAGRRCMAALVLGGACWLSACGSGGSGDDDTTGAGGEAGEGGAGGAGTGGEANGGAAGGGEPSLCATHDTTGWTGDGEPFSAPQAVVFAGDLLVVGNTAAAWNADAGRVDFGAGSITLIDPATGAYVGQIATSAPNPQKLVVRGDRLYVVNTGTTFYDGEAGEVHATGAGSVDIFDLATLAAATAPTATLPLAFDETKPLIGAPIDLAFVGARGYLTSGTGSVLFVFDAETQQWERGGDNPVVLGGAVTIGLGSAAATETALYVADFNTDRLYRVGTDGVASACAVEVGQAADLEGASAPRVAGDDLYVMMTVAGTVERRSLAALEAAFAAGCGAVPADATIAPIGMYPNDLQVVGDHLLVVASGDNRVVEYDAGGGEVRSYDLSPGANPWAVALQTGAGRLAITEQAGNGVTVFDATCEPHQWRLGNPATP